MLGSLVVGSINVSYSYAIDCWGWGQDRVENSLYEWLCCYFPGQKRQAGPGKENETSSGPRDEGLWDEKITSYVTACIPGLRVLASCGQLSTPSSPSPLCTLLILWRCFIFIDRTEDWNKPGGKEARINEKARKRLLSLLTLFLNEVSLLIW